MHYLSHLLQRPCTVEGIGNGLERQEEEPLSKQWADKQDLNPFQESNLGKCLR